MVNVDVRVLFTDGERAARAGEHDTARACFIEAGQCAADVQLWRSAIRCYRHALELDLLDRDAVDRIGRMPPRVISGRGWDDYRTALDQHGDVGMAEWGRMHWPIREQEADQLLDPSRQYQSQFKHGY